MIFLSHELFWFCLVQVCTTQFCWFPPAFMSNARPFDDAEHAVVLNSQLQDLSSNFGSLDGHVSDLERVGVAPQIQWRRDSRPSSQENFRSSRCISGRWHRFPCSYRDTRRRPDKFSSPDDESARSAVLLRFLCEQCHACVSARLKKTLALDEIPDRILSKTGTTTARLVFNTRAKSQEVVARYRDGGLPHACNTRCTILVRSHQKTEKSEDVLHHSAPNYMKFFLNMTPKATMSF